MRPGLRDELITDALREEIDAITAERTLRDGLDPGEAAHRIGGHLAAVAKRVLEGVPESERPARQVEVANEVLAFLAPEDQIALPPEVLLCVFGEPANRLGQAPTLPPRPEIPLSMSDLLFNGAGQPTIGSELRLELESAEGVDLLCAFVIWSGVRVLKEQLAGVVERGGRLRVITTTYMAATEPKALNALVELGAQVKVAFDARITKLHAKSWLLDRAGNLSTAFIGSSNLSHTALHEGLEWNVRLSEMDAPHLLARMRATFDAHWADDHFEAYDPTKDAVRLRRALGEDAKRRQGDPSVSFVGLDVHPYPHQRRMLERLQIERERHDRHRNLIVAATGTGKTVVAALDYRGLRQAAGRDLSLLFVAHRRRILDQSLHAFRHVLHDGAFGELLGDGERPKAGHHVFAMIQSLDSDAIAKLAPEAYDIVIVDEFHHVAAPTYNALLERLAPAELLGLTATPERMDGKDVTEWFGGRIAVELRLWEAIDQGFLAPFQYFGVSDGTDLSRLEWRRGGYLARDLNSVLTGDDARVSKLLEALNRIADDPHRMRALGFCVSVEHAKYMAERFTRAGLPAVAISGATPGVERDDALRRLGSGELRVVFSVDVLGEGVDVPNVDTILLLRPTQSATVLTQQLGRGLRRAEGKRCLTVIDLIGQQHRQFRFDNRLRALIDPARGSVRQQVENGFPLLPAGCEISLDRVSREIVLDNLRDVARLGQWRTLVDDLRRRGDADLARFLEGTDRAPADLYRGPDRSWTRLRRDAGLPTLDSAGKDERALLRAIGRLLHLDDRERVDFYLDVLRRAAPPSLTSINERNRRLLTMLHVGLWGVRRRFPSLADGFNALWQHQPVLDELAALLAIVGQRSDTVTRPSGLPAEVPISVHASYGRDEVLAAFGLGDTRNPPQLREGVRWVEEGATDLFFITLHKTEREYSPTTMYRDYAISPSLFHWESQSTLRERAPTAQRYIHHKERGSHVLLFARDRARSANGAAEPYLCLGPATYVSHQGEQPLAITWQLRDPMPESLFEVARAVAAA